MFVLVLCASPLLKLKLSANMYDIFFFFCLKKTKAQIFLPGIITAPENIGHPNRPERDSNPRLSSINPDP